MLENVTQNCNNMRMRGAQNCNNMRMRGVNHFIPNISSLLEFRHHQARICPPEPKAITQRDVDAMRARMSQLQQLCHGRVAAASVRDGRAGVVGDRQRGDKRFYGA